MPEYKNLEIRAAKGLHEDCITLIQRHVPKGSKMIDLAAGAGAFSERLVDVGYKVTSNDIDDKKWQPSHISKLTLDLDKPLEPYLVAPGYTGVVAMEVIEHLQNSSKLLEDCKRLVADNGVMLLSTPKVLDLESRLTYLRSGFLFHIIPQSYFATGRRTILPFWLLELFIDKAGLEIVERQWGGEVPSSNNGPWWRVCIYRVIRRLARLFIKSPNSDELKANYLIYLLRARWDDQMENIS